MNVKNMGPTDVLHGTGLCELSLGYCFHNEIYRHEHDARELAENHFTVCFFIFAGFTGITLGILQTNVYAFQNVLW